MSVIDTLEALAITVRNETKKEANSSIRIGDLFLAIIYFLKGLASGQIRQEGVDTYNDTSGGKTSLLNSYPMPQIGWCVLIRYDETYGGKATLRQWNGTIWVNLETTVYEDDIMLSGGSTKTGQQLDDEKSNKTDLTFINLSQINNKYDYTSDAARAAVPTSERFRGKCIAYYTGVEWVNEQFIGETLVSGWGVVTNWRRVDFQTKYIHTVGLINGFTYNFNINTTTRQLTYTGNAAIIWRNQRFTINDNQTIDIPSGTQFFNLSLSTSGVITIAQQHIPANIPENNIVFAGLYLSVTNVNVTGIQKEHVSVNGLPWVEDLSMGVNKFISEFRSAATDADKKIINNAILDVKWYNVPASGFRAFYAIGKNYAYNSSTNRTYLGFYLNDGGASYAVAPLGWSAQYVDNAPEGTFVGTKSYKLARVGQQNVVGEIILNWDAIKSGTRSIESTSGASNSKFGSWTFIENTSTDNTLYKSAIVFDESALTKYYDTAVNIDYSTGTSIPLGLANVNDFYALFDALMALDTTYITKKTIATDVGGSGLNMYAYEFTPTRSNDGGPNNLLTNPKIFITLATHGTEKTGAVCCYEFMKQVVTNWKNNEFLSFVRHNISFVIVPSHNPTGWNASSGTGTRKNFNGVDLNRNYPVGWVLGSDPNDATYGGTAPFSEPESQAIRDLLSTYDSPFIGIDFHNFFGVDGNPIESYGLTWNEASSTFVNQVGQALSRTVTPVIQQKNTDTPQGDNFQVGSTSIVTGGGRAAAYMQSLGYYSSTFEVAQYFRYTAGYKANDANAIRFGTEIFGNYLRLMIIYCARDWNSKQ